VDRITKTLHERICSIPRGRDREPWLASLRQEFDHLRAHLLKHFALEESEGYLIPVLEQRPTLTGEVERLKQEHSEMQQILDGIHHQVREVSPESSLMIRDICSRICAVLRFVDEHEERENLLVSFVFTQDIGSKD
jgi:iron-sulfur cluster repair protein YtfE (RIC family)